MSPEGESKTFKLLDHHVLFLKNKLLEKLCRSSHICGGKGIVDVSKDGPASELRVERARMNQREGVRQRLIGDWWPEKETSDGARFGGWCGVRRQRQVDDMWGADEEKKEKTKTQMEPNEGKVEITARM